MAAQVVDTAFDPALEADSGTDAGTPTEQAQTPAAAAPKPTPPVDPLFQREFTQTRQKWSAVVGALGLEKDTPVDVITARIAELQAPRGEDDSPVDQATIQRQRALEAREWAVEERLHGDTAIQARKLIEKLRSHPNMSPSDVADAFYEAVEVAKAQGSAAPEEQAAPEPQPTFGQEAPLTPRQPGGIDATNLDPADAKGREALVQDSIRAKLAKQFGFGG